MSDPETSPGTSHGTPTSATPAEGVAQTLSTGRRGPGWLWVPIGFVILALVTTFGNFLIWRLSMLPGGDYLCLVFREIEAFGTGGQAIITITLLLGAGVLEYLSRRNRLYLWKFLLPAFFWLLAGVMCSVLHSYRFFGSQVRDIVALSRDLGPEGILGIGIGLGVFGLGFMLMEGRNTKCPECGTWWSIPLSSTLVGSETSTGGHFASDGSGWVHTRTTRSTFLCSFRCRACRHEWSGRFAMKSKTKSRT